MSNTVIQIKRSTVTTVPGSLSAGEPAYSYLSDKLFIGDSTGSGVIEIGGRFYNNVAVQAYNAANAAYAQANTIASDADEKANAAIITANAAFGVANLGFDHANASYAFANSVYSNYAYPAFVAVGPAYDQANSANLLAYNTGIGANAFASATIAGANTAVGAGANAYAAAVGTSANAYTDAATVAANSYSSAVGVAANTYANQTFVKLTAANQTITGNVTITGSITVTGNAFSIDTETLRVSDPLLYLAGNNYTSDVVDIGFIGNYVNTTGANVHTGLFREHTNKEYYLFQEYSEEPYNNHIDVTGNNFTLAVLNADLVTSNLSLGGQNTIVWINAAFNKANAAAVSGNSAAVAANTYAATVGVSANAYADVVGTSANLYASAVGTAANSYADNIVSGGMNSTGAGANAYAAAVGTSANLYTDTATTAANSYASAVGVAANLYASTVGTSANLYADAVGTAANTNAANGSYISTGVVKVAYGGTGQTTFTTNGVLYGNGGNALQVTGAGTEGQVLQANASGVPTFGMLDGGSF